jgi:hypothetical protein
MITLPSHGSSAGPLLRALLEAQRKDEESTAYPLIGEYARRIAVLCRRLGDPVLWPVGPAAERLVGAAVVISEGAAQARGWSSSLNDTDVLLVGTVATGPVELVAAASHARALYAVRVHACAIDVPGVDQVAEGTFDSFAGLDDLPISPASGRLERGLGRHKAKAA